MILRNISDVGIAVTTSIRNTRKALSRSGTAANKTVIGNMLRRSGLGRWHAVALKARRTVEAQRKPPRAPVAYEYRLVLFLDFLGFKELVEQTAGDPSRLYELLETIDIVEEIGDGCESTPSEQLTQFSDSIVVSYRITEPSAVFHLLNNIALAVIKIAGRGVLIRGAVTIGQLYHTDKYVVGPALNEAYRLESTVAKSPRILIDPAVLEVARHFRIDIHTPGEEAAFVEAFLTEDDDGLFFFDYISFEDVTAVCGGQENLYPNYLRTIGEMVERGLKHADARVQKKYLWLHRKYTAARSSVAELDADNVLRLEFPDVYETISALPEYRELAEAAKEAVAQLEAAQPQMLSSAPATLSAGRSSPKVKRK